MQLKYILAMGLMVAVNVTTGDIESVYRVVNVDGKKTAVPMDSGFERDIAVVVALSEVFG